MKVPDPVVSVNTSLGRRAGTGLYRKKSSFWAVTGACLFRKQKYQSEMMKAMSATLPPTVPPTIAPKLGDVEEVVAVGDAEVELVLVLVLVGVPVDRDEPGVGVTLGVTEIADIVGVLEANAPIPCSVGVGFI